MAHELNPAFQEALRQLGRPTTLDDLRRRGVGRVRAVKSSEISLLIERAVNRTLMERTIGPLDEAQRIEVLHEAQNQFTSQLLALEDLASTHAAVAEHRRESQAELARLRAALEERIAAGDASAEGTAPTAETRAQLATEILACIEPLFPGGRIDGVGRRIARELQALVDAHVASAVEERRREFQRELENQERRVAKLVQSLERTEQVLARVAAAKDLETGIESIYRTVQGLSRGEQDFERKRELLACIFDANLSLRRDLQSAH